MLITPVPFNTQNYKSQKKLLNFGISQNSQHKAPMLPEITPNKISQIIKNPTIFHYATITVQSKQNADTWRIMDVKGDNTENAIILMKKEAEERTVSTDELCTDYKNWCSLFTRGCIHPIKPSTQQSEISSTQQPETPSIQTPKEMVQPTTTNIETFDTITETLFPDKNVNPKNLLLHMISLSPDKYLIRAKMKDGTIKQISKICLMHQKINSVADVADNIKVVFKTTTSNQGQEEFMTFKQFYKNCERINFFNLNQPNDNQKQTN